jgi:hypothetical protein
VPRLPACSNGAMERQRCLRSNDLSYINSPYLQLGNLMEPMCVRQLNDEVDK